MNYIYRYMKGTQWIYVGKSVDDIHQRVYAHAHDSRFQQFGSMTIEYCEFPTKSDMDIVEKMLIKTMKPKINVTDATIGDIPFYFDDSSICWKPYKKEMPAKAKSKYGVTRSEVNDYFRRLLYQNCDDGYFLPDGKHFVIFADIKASDMQRFFGLEHVSPSKAMAIIRNKTHCSYDYDVEIRKTLMEDTVRVNFVIRTYFRLEDKPPEGWILVG